MVTQAFYPVIAFCLEGSRAVSPICFALTRWGQCAYVPHSPAVHARPGLDIVHGWQPPLHRPWHNRLNANRLEWRPQGLSQPEKAVNRSTDCHRGLRGCGGYPGNETAGPPSTLHSVGKHFQEGTAETADLSTALPRISCGGPWRSSRSCGFL
jgi:hypothetical protein